MRFASIWFKRLRETWRLRQTERSLEIRYSLYNKSVGVPIWNRSHTRKVNLRNFRSDNVFVWQKRNYGLSHLEAAARIAVDLDDLTLIDVMDEDGSYGAETYEYQGKKFSRELVDSILELNYLFKFFPAGVGKILDIGAGYGRFSYRALQAGFAKQAVCVDAIPIGTITSRVYLDQEIRTGKAEVIGVDELDKLKSSGIDIAINIHSFSEMSLSAVETWVQFLRLIQVPWLFIVPNPPTLSLNNLTSFEDVLKSNGFQVFDQREKYSDHILKSKAMYPSNFFLLRRSNKL